MEIATGIIDKLQEENRTCLETLHKAQDTIKYKDRQLAEKDRLIQVLEERVRAGTDGILEMANRQKDLTIKHLDTQMQKLMNENEDLEERLEALKAEICPKCETKLLLKENAEKRGVSKSLKVTGKFSSTIHDKKHSQTVCPNRVKSLEKIIEHKDKRIMHLTKEVQRLTKIEKESALKIHRLTKLLPMSRLPPEAVTDCLLQEIQLLESQNRDFDDSYKKSVSDVLNKYKKDVGSASRVPLTRSSKSSDRFKTSSAPNVKFSMTNIHESKQSSVSDMNRAENEVLLRKLQKLYNDINELKRLFAFESDKLSHNLNITANEYQTFKAQLEELIDNLNDVVQSILGNDFRMPKGNTSLKSDDSYVISCLQERLKETLELVTEYENENKALKENLEKLKAQKSLQQAPLDYFRRFDEKIFKSFSDSKLLSNVNDVQKLREIIKMKETQLEDAQRHIENCQKFIIDLQNNTKSMNFDSSKMQEKSSRSIVDLTTPSSEQQSKLLQIKLDVAEKNIKECENVIEKLQNKITSLEEENEKLESDLVQAKSKALSVESTTLCSALSETHVVTLQKLNLELQNKVKTVEEANKKLTEDKNVSLKKSEDEKTLFIKKLDASEKQICTLEKSIETLQGKLKTSESNKQKLSDELKVLEEEKKKLEDEIKEIRLKENQAKAYENDVMALKNELILKEDENKELKSKLNTLENKNMEMNHYRKSLHQEIENLCKALLEDDGEDNERRKAIYKAAVLRMAQALLGLDDNYNLKSDESGSALDEMKYQIQVYLNEVSRIHELITIKEQARDELLREYLDLPDDTLRPSTSRHHEAHIQGEPTSGNLNASFPNLNSSKPLDLRCNEKIPDLKTSSDKLDSLASSLSLKTLQDELASQQSVCRYLLSNCTSLEASLTEEKKEHARCRRELEICQETIKDLKAQLHLKEDMTKRLNILIDMMRSKEYNDEITLEQLKSEIQWLIDENQKIFEKVTATQSELSHCREENSRIQNDLDSVKRQLLNKEYENIKVNNELKHLRLQLTNSQSTFNS